jgi:aerobic carbon-monoxide dehydrogenase medium subunit
MISKEYAFEAPKQLSEALGLLEKYGDDAKVLAGGMSLVPTMTLGLVQPEVVISLNHIPNLDYVKEEGNVLKIGALTRHDTVRKHPLIQKHCPLLSEAATLIGDVQIRHRGSIGGSIAHADPAADYPPVMLVLGAQIRLQRAKGERTVPASGFFKDLMQTALEGGELVTEIQVPKLPADAGSAYLRLHRVEGNFAIVAAAAVVEKGFKSVRLGLAGIGPKALLVDVTARFKNGLSDAALDGVRADALQASADAYGDLNGDADYRRAMAQVYAVRAIRTAAGRAR